MRFIINEAVQRDSQIWHLIPNMNNAWSTAAIALQGRLNNYHHGQLKPDLRSLLQIASLFDSIASSSGLGVSDWARALTTRIKQILSGSFEKPIEAAEQDIEIPVAPVEISKRYDNTQKEISKRPPLGSRWQGEKPQRKLVLDRATRELYEDGISVAAQLGELGEQTVTTWLPYFPRGGEVWVDTDGASMAYVKGVSRMVGWLGPEPEPHEDEVRGFVVPRDYEFTGRDVRDLGSGRLLTQSSIESVKGILEALSTQLEPNQRLFITDYGDIFKSNADGTVKKLARAHKNIWFEGQLPG
jgi:hypothetical protein